MSSIYKESPSIGEMERSRQYRKTLKTYRIVIQRGMMILLEDLEDFPAPVLCPFCEVPVVTRAKKERSGAQWFNVAFATVASAGILTHQVYSMNKDIVHECPACGGALATWKSLMNGGLHGIKVHAFYNGATSASPSQSASGHSVEQFQVSGYGKVHVGNQIYITAPTSEHMAGYVKDGKLSQQDSRT